MANASFTKIVLSGSSNGRGIPITGVTFSNMTLIHTGITGANDYDEVFVYVAPQEGITSNSEIVFSYGPTVARSVTAGVSGNRFRVAVTNQSGPILVIPGWPLNAGGLVEAHVTAAARVIAYGYVHRRAT